MSSVLTANLRNVLDKILGATREVELIRGSEEDLKQRVERVLYENVWSKLKTPNPRYEYRVDVGTYVKSYGRIDALYGLTIFEYKKPGVLRTKERDEAVKKLVEVYIPGLR